MLQKALASALSQTYPHVEIIVSDNGSGDDTPQVMAKYADDRIRYIRHEPGIHPMDNWNLLWQEGSGEYFVMLHDDDWLEPSFCERLVNIYQKYPEIKLAVSGVYFHRGDEIEESRLTPGVEIEEGYNLACDFFEWKRSVHLCCLMFRTDDLERTGGFSKDYGFSQDTAVWLPLAMEGKVGFAQEHLGHYYLHEGSGTHTVSILPRLEDHLKLAQVCMSIAAKRGLDDSTMRLLSRVSRRNLGRTAARFAVEQAESGVSKAKLHRMLKKWHQYIMADPADALPRTIIAYAMPASLVALIHSAHTKRKHRSQ